MTNNQESKIVKLIIEWKWFTRGTMSRTTNQHMWYGLWLHSMDNGYFGQDHVKRPLPDNIIKPRDTLGNVSDWETTLICTWRASKIPRIYLILCSKYLPLELEIWVFLKILDQYYARFHVNRSATHHKSSWKSHLVQTYKFKPQRFTI